MVHQHFMLIPVMTVAENIVLGIEPSDKGFLDYDAARARVRELARTFGFQIDPDARIEDIGVGQQQRVEILKALYRNAGILILDEPTAVLTPQEATEFFGILQTLQREGISIVFISHKLNEVLEIADRVTVLRRGKNDRDPAARGGDAGVARAGDGRPRGRASGRQGAGGARRRAARGRGPPRPGRPGDREGARRLADRARRRDRRSRRRRRQRPERADRRHHGPAQDRAGHGARRGEGAPSRERARRARCGRGADPSGSPAARAGARVLDRRERRAARLPQGAEREGRVAVPATADREGAEADPRVRRPRRRPRDARGRAVGRQPAEGDPRARDRSRPEGADRSAADARARRRRDRVRAQAADRGTRRGTGDPPRLARARRDPLARRPDPRHLRGRDRRRVPADGRRGGARVRDDRGRKEAAA